MFLKKKEKGGVQVSSPGRATPVQNYKGVEGERFLHPKLFPLISKTPKLTETTRTVAPELPLLSFLLPFSRFNSLQQVSVQSLSFLLPIGVFSSSFGALNCENMLIFVGQFWSIFYA